MTYRTRNILMASGLALVAIVFMWIYVSNARDDGDVGKNPVSVFIASRNIDAGTPGSSLTTSLVEKRIPLKTAVPGAIASPTELRGLVATENTLSGEQVTRRRFGPIDAIGPRVQVAKRQRVVQLAGNVNQVLDGTLKTGDRVDIIAAWSYPPSCDDCKIVRTIVRDVLVLGTSADLPSSGGGLGTGTKSVQLRLSDREAERVYWMDQNGSWRLALRPVIKPRNSKPDTQTARTIRNVKAR